MKEKRNSYLVTRSLKIYLVAAIASMAVVNINQIVDSFLMGRFLGPDAFSAINLCLPAIAAVGGLMALFYAGAAIVASVALGERDRHKSDAAYSISMICVMALSLIITAVVMLFGNGISRLICIDETLRAYVKDYLVLVLGASPIVLTSSALKGFTDVGGKPKLVTFTSIMEVVVNLLCDVIYVYVLDMGIKGAALATISGAAVSIIIIIAEGRIHARAFSFRLPEKGDGAVLRENVLYGFPSLLTCAVGVVTMYATTMFAQTFCGVNGAFVVSVLVQATTLNQAVSGGIGMSVNALGGMLMGQKDFRGLRFLINRGLMISAVFSIILYAALAVSAPYFVMFMGGSGGELIAYASASMRMGLPFIVPNILIAVFTSIYTLTGQLRLVNIMSILQPIVTVSTLFIFGRLGGADLYWLAYPVYASLLLIIVLILSEVIRRKEKTGLVRFTLLPPASDDKHSFDISVECMQEGLVESLKGIGEFFDDQQIDRRLCMRVRLCIEEMMMNIVEHADRNADQFLDLRVIIGEEQILAMIKDDGRQFDPVHAAEKGAGLRIINGLCPDIDYKYLYGQNMTFMTWTR